MTKPRIILATVALLQAIAGAVFADNVLGAEYIVLVDPNPAPPPLMPTQNWTQISKVSIYHAVAKLGPIFNKSVVSSELKRRFDAYLNRGLSEASKAGQAGVLLKVQVTVQPTAPGPSYALRNDGVGLVGRGPSAEAVCYAVRCYQSLEGPLAAGVSLAENSSYVWISRHGASTGAKTYSIDTLENKTRQLRLNAAASSEYAKAIRAEAMNDYVEYLSRTLKSQDAATIVQKLITERNKARVQQQSVEQDLAKELKRAERAAATSASLNAVAAALSFASQLAMANITAGEDVSAYAPSGIHNSAELTQALHAMRQDANGNILLLRARQTTIRNDLTGVEEQILEIESREFGRNVRPDGSGSAFSPIP